MDSMKRWLVPAVLAGVLAFGATSAQAARDVYPPSDNVRTLDSGDAGWTDSTDTAGPCVPVLLCPTVTNSVEPTGGAPGGYLRTAVSNFAGVDATAIGTFVSPTFKYEGVGGEKPDSVKLRLSRIADVAAFLDVTGDGANYSVQLVDTTSGPNVQLIAPTTMAGAEDFTEIRPVDIEPNALKVGHVYRVRIVSTFTSGTAQVIPDASAGYDNIRLVAQRNAGGGNTGGSSGSNGSNGNNGANGGNGSNGGNGGNGGNGNGGHGAGGRFDGNGVVAGAAKLKGDRLILKVKCKTKPRSRCRVNVQALMSRRGPAVSNKRTARVKAGSKRKVSLDLKGKYAAKVARRGKVVIKQVVRKGGKTTRGYKKVKVKAAS
jgi:hypothetical protein